jgi:glycogen phosphorylase
VVGAPMTRRAAVQLAGLKPSDVLVQAVVGRVDEADQLDEPTTVQAKHVGKVDGSPDAADRFEAVVPLPHAGLLGYTVRVLPSHDLLATPAELGKIVLAE